MRSLIVGILILCIMSCSSQDSSNAQQGLVVGFDNAPRSFDPRFALDANSQYLTNLIHCSLIEYTPEGQYQNQVAESVRWKDNHHIYIKIKPNYNFITNQGKAIPVRAKDVKATFDFFLKHSDKTPRSAAFQSVEKIDLINELELVMKMKKIDAAFIVNSLGVGILPESLANKLEQIKNPQEMTSCGSHRLEKISQGRVELKSVKKEGEDILIKVVKDEGTRFLKLQKGELGLAQNLNREKIANLKKYPKLKMKKRLGLNTSYLAFNMRDKIVGNQKVRQAMAHAIDKKSLIKYILKDMAKVADNLLVPGTGFDNHKIKSPELNIEKAKALLDEAGFSDPDGDGPKPRFSLQYKTTTDKTRVTIAKAIVTQLKKIGIDIKLQTLEWGKFKKDVEEGKAQIWSLRWVGFKDPDILHYVFHSKHHAPKGGNRGFYTNKLLDNILDQARELTDINERKKLYFQAQEILANDLPYINLWHEEIFAVFHKDYEQYNVFADGRFQSLKDLQLNSKLK